MEKKCSVVRIMSDEEIAESLTEARTKTKDENLNDLIDKTIDDIKKRS